MNQKIFLLSIRGGESTTGNESVSDLLFNSRANYDKAIGKRHVMQGSCNVTGMGKNFRTIERQIWR